MLYTIGHSTLTWEDFIKLLIDNSINELVDIRSHPGSHIAPQFNRKFIMTELPKHIRYLWETRVGGWTPEFIPSFSSEKQKEVGIDLTAYNGSSFPKQRIGRKVPKSVLPLDAPAWTNQGLYDYQFFMTISDFNSAMTSISNRAKNSNVAMMCAEVLWLQIIVIILIFQFGIYSLN